MAQAKQPTRLNRLQHWMSKASSDEKKAFAELAGTTVGTLRQVAGAYRTDGKLRVDSDFAIALEQASITMREKNPRLPLILRIHLSPVCASCEIAKAHFSKR
jgi:hypothetical protein